MTKISLKTLSRATELKANLDELDQAIAHTNKLAGILFERDNVTLSFIDPETQDRKEHRHTMQRDMGPLSFMFGPGVSDKDCDCPSCRAAREYGQDKGDKMSDFIINIDNQMTMSLMAMIIKDLELQKMEVINAIESLGFKE